MVAVTRRAILIGAGAAAFAGVGGARAQGARVLSAPEAYERARSGDVALIDIRTEREWRDSGVPTGAHRLSLTDPGFLGKLNAILGGDKSAPAALICATGGRSAMAARALRGLGYAGVMDVSEGMFGSSAGPGWTRRGLPVERSGDRGSPCATC